MDGTPPARETGMVPFFQACQGTQQLRLGVDHLQFNSTPRVWFCEGELLGAKGKLQTLCCRRGTKKPGSVCVCV